VPLLRRDQAREQRVVDGRDRPALILVVYALLPEVDDLVHQVHLRPAQLLDGLRARASLERDQPEELPAVGLRHLHELPVFVLREEPHARRALRRHVELRNVGMRSSRFAWPKAAAAITRSRRTVPSHTPSARRMFTKSRPSARVNASRIARSGPTRGTSGRAPPPCATGRTSAARPTRDVLPWMSHSVGYVGQGCCATSAGSGPIVTAPGSSASRCGERLPVDVDELGAGLAGRLDVHAASFSVHCCG
jgi:hypothetical protein